MDRHRREPRWFIFMKFEKKKEGKSKGENKPFMRCAELVWSVIWWARP